MIVQLGKTFEHTTHFLRLNSCSGIRYVENNLVIHQLITITDTSFFRKLNSIPNQIRNHLEHSILVRLNHQTLVRRLIDKAYSLRSTEYMSIVHFPAEIMETSRTEGKLDGSRFNLREIENLVDKLQKTLVVRVYDVVVRLSFFRIITFGNEMREPHNSIQRSTYLMTHIGKESRFQTIRHFRFFLRRQ